MTRLSCFGLQHEDFFIARPDMPAYQSDNLLHGLLSRCDVDLDFLTISPRHFAINRFKELPETFWYLFNNASESRLRSKYGRGFTHYGKFTPLNWKINTPNTWFCLLNKKYDLVIYGAVRWNATLLPLFCKLHRHRIVVVDGDDNNEFSTLSSSFCGCKFKRELW